MGNVARVECPQRILTKEATPMTKALSSWRRDRRFRAMVRELKTLSAGELRMLGIPAADINRLALEASRLQGVNS